MCYHHTPHYAHGGGVPDPSSHMERKATQGEGERGGEGQDAKFQGSGTQRGQQYELGAGVSLRKTRTYKKQSRTSLEHKCNSGAPEARVTAKLG